MKLFSKPTAPLALSDQAVIAAQERADHQLAADAIDATDLLAHYPPKVQHPKKLLLFKIALARGLKGAVRVRRFREIPLPATYQPYSAATEIVARKGYFRYATSSGSDDWFLNFAHHDLFHGYGHFMFAQDEIQVAEHPALACLREWMLSRTDSLRPVAVEEGSATPVLIRGVQRTLAIDTRSIYGARFGGADDAVICEAACVVDPSIISNILAIEAPINTGERIYSRATIECALRTAYAGFRAVVLASMEDCSPTLPVAIHTGNWGCGAYGGNRQLMLSVQMIAARLAGVSRIVFYCGGDSTDDVALFDAALSQRFQFRPGVKVSRCIDQLVAAAFPWGKPDGN